MATPVLILHGFVIAVLTAVYLALTLDGQDGTLILGALLAQIANTGMTAKAQLGP